MDKLKQIKDKLVSCVEDQINCLETTNAEELGEAVDMIKDLDEAIYYCTMTKTIEDKYGSSRDMSYYGEKGRPMEIPYRGYDDRDPMYYSGNNMGGGRMGVTSYSHHDPYMDGYNYPTVIPQYGNGQEGKSGMRRRMYMEGKMKRQDKTKQMQELEAYVQDLGQDLTEMIQDASPEEKQLLQQKISMLATKIK